VRPTREHATSNGQTYMVTSATWGRRTLFSGEPWAHLLIDTIYHYRSSAYLLHELVVMPDHVHVLLTPKTSLEKAVQFIKGGFSYRAKKELGSNMEVWQKGFSDHRIRDAEDYLRHVSYIRDNPVRRRLCERAEEFPYSSGHLGFEFDPVPQGLKPAFLEERDTARLEGVPFQNGLRADVGEGAPFQDHMRDASETALVQGNTNPDKGSAEIQTALFQNKISSRRVEFVLPQPKTKTA
jgi:putative transposase